VPSEDQKKGVYRIKPDRWKADIISSVDMYNDRFMKFAPSAYRETRVKTTKDVEIGLDENLNRQTFRCFPSFQ
jgi:hypothetical protein